MRLAIVCSAHGFGHLGRQLALGNFWKSQGVDADFFTAVPRDTVRQWLPDAQVVPWTVDIGLYQPDSLREDLGRTREILAERCSETRIDALAGVLRAYDRVLVDIAPAALEAARRAGKLAVAVGNFDWAWTYRQYPELQDWAAQFAAWQAPHPAVSLWPGPGLSGFRSVVEGGLLARHSEEAWKGPERTVLVCFGGFGLQDIDAWLPVIDGVTWVLAPPMPRLLRPDCLYVDNVPFPALVAGVDMVFSKPGYGILGECLRAGTPMIWAPRGSFPEAPSLVKVMEERGDESVEAGIEIAWRRRWAKGRPAPVLFSEQEVGQRILKVLSE